MSDNDKSFNDENLKYMVALAMFAAVLFYFGKRLPLSEAKKKSAKKGITDFVSERIFIGNRDTDKLSNKESSVVDLLEAKLKIAVAKENYEEAANLRDKIKRLKS